jgi:hypothetical protein
MNLVSNKTIDIPSAPKVKSKASVEIQTVPIQWNDIGTESLEPDAKSTQTEKLSIKPPSAKHIRISSTIVQLILNELDKCEQEKQHFAELDAFHQNQTMQLDEIRTMTIETV